MARSVDRSFCTDRCNERGVCFLVDGAHRCLCDAGFISDDCAQGTTMMAAIPREGPNGVMVGSLVFGECFRLVFNVFFC
ncbi:unnamed protein product [Heligmosomoides polygyrus]|uniref:EGF-like domain-containing protein n=1 Tax=Heligmosomoides polygyrus TaxID=6339 RepID=A0A183FZP9_HELPZ|nr:unnamed protein product [Heligmosomoides polygyrus]